MKKIVFLFTMFIAVCFVLVGCGDIGGGPTTSTYKIIFDSNGGSKVEAIVAEAGAEIVAPTDPTKEGFIFAGWYLGEVKYEFSVMPETNITLFAKWEEVVVPVTKYTITLDVNGGNALLETTITAEAGAAITLPTPTKEGYTFLGWYNGETKFEATAMPEANLTLVAKWEEVVVPVTKYTIILDVNGGNALAETTITAEAGAAITLPVPTKDGYNFLGWYNGEAKFEATTMPEFNLTLVAKWEEVVVPVTKYTITLDVNGGNALAETTITAEAGAAITLPTPTKEGYTFAGWLLEGALFNETTMPEANLTLVAKWEEIPAEKVVITYVLNGGNAIYPTHADMVADFIKDLNAMTGKSIADATELYNAGDIYHLLFNDDAMNAKWGWIPKFFLSLWQQGYGNYSELEAEYTAYINKNAKEDMGEYGYQWGMRQNIQGLMTLSRCAKFAGSGAIDFTLYQINSQIEGLIGGGKYVSEIEANSSLIQAYRYGYTLEGWYADEALTQKVNSVSESTTLYAKWDKVYNKITYVLNNVDATMDSTVVNFHASETVEFAKPIYDETKWRFDGWYSDPECTMSISSIGTRYGKDLTVYAAWTELTGYVITYNLNGGNWTYADREATVQDFLNDYNAARGKSHTADTFKSVGPWAEISDASLFLYANLNKWGWLVDYIASVAGSANKSAWSNFKKYTSQAELNAANGNYIYSIAYELRGFIGEIKYTQNGSYHTADYTQIEIANGFWETFNATQMTESLGNKGEVNLPTPFKEYYDFEGWYLSEDLSGTPVTTVSETTTLYAKWVEGIKVETITITNKVSEIKRFETLQLEWALNPTNPSIKTVKFETSDSSVATVDANGLVTTLNAGTVTIKIISQASGKKTDEFTLEVFEPDHFEASYQTNSYVTIGGEIKLLAEYVKRDGSNAQIVWESLNNDLATVNAGTVTGVKEGVATIRAKVSETVYFDFKVTVLPSTVSAAMQHAINSHESNIHTTYNLGVGAGTPAYYMDILGSLSKLLMNHEYTVDRTMANKEVNNGTGDYYTMGTIEYITVHYTGNMGVGSDAEANAKYFVGDNSVSIHYTTGNDGVYQALTHDKGGWHAGSGSTTAGWNATGVMYDENDPKWPVWGISSNAKFTINGKETTITVPYKDQRGNEGYVTDSKWLNAQGFGFKIVNGQYYMNNVRWSYSQVSEGRIVNNGGNINSIGIESCVDKGSDLWLTWQITAQHVAHLLVETGLDITRVVGHHFFDGKDCPQPLLENNLELWWEFIALVEAEYEAITTYKDAKFVFDVEDGVDFVDENGRVIDQPEFNQVVTYTVTVGGQTITLATMVEGIYNK